MTAPVFNTHFEPHWGTPILVADGVVRVVAPNASAYTFTGTNTYIIGHAAVFVVDPGPDDDAHFNALIAAIAGRPVTAIILTHTHNDHSSLAARLAQAIKAPIWFEGPHRLSRPKLPFEINVLSGSCDWGLKPDRILHHGEKISTDGIALEIIATPGHCANHIALGICDTEFLLSGDHVMGWNSTLIAVPDGSMADYFASIAALADLAYSHYLPGHGGPIVDGREHARRLGLHRQKRNDQICDALQADWLSIGDLRDRIYVGLPRANLGAAAMTLKAHIEYLSMRGTIKQRLSLTGWRYQLVGVDGIIGGNT